MEAANGRKTMAIKELMVVTWVGWVCVCGFVLEREREASMGKAVHVKPDTHDSDVGYV